MVTTNGKDGTPNGPCVFLRARASTEPFAFDFGGGPHGHAFIVAPTQDRDASLVARLTPAEREDLMLWMDAHPGENGALWPGWAPAFMRLFPAVAIAGTD